MLCNTIFSFIVVEVPDKQTYKGQPCIWWFIYFIKESEKNERTTPGIAGIHMHCRNIQFIKICLHPIYRLRMYTKALGFLKFFFKFWKTKCLCQLLKLTIIRDIKYWNQQYIWLFVYMMFSATCIPSIPSNLNTRAHCYDVNILNESTRVMMVWVYMIENYTGKS